MLDGNWVRKRVDQVLVPVVNYFLTTYTAILADIAALTAEYNSLETTLTGDVISLTNLIGTDISNLTSFVVSNYAPLNSPPLVGNPTAPTPDETDDSTTIATTAFVVNKIALATTGVSQVVGFTGVVSLANLVTGGVAPLASPSLTGVPTAPTPTTGDSSTKVSTTAFVGNTIAALNISLFPATANLILGTSGTAGIASTIAIGTNLSLVGGVLNATYTYTLPTATSSVLGGVKPDNTTITNTAGVIKVTYGTATNTAAQGNDARIVGALAATTAATTYAPLVSPPLTGTPTAPTAAPGTNTTQLATTAYTTAAVAVASAAVVTETTRAEAAEALKAPLSSPSFTGSVFTTNLSAEADIGVIGAGYAPAYLYSSATGWGLYSSDGNAIISYTRATSQVTINAGATSTVVDGTLSVGGSMTVGGNSVVTNNGGSYNLNITGTAGNSTKLIGANWNWSGQTGQPSWLWGGNDPSNMYVYNPSNFHVAYSVTSGSTQIILTPSGHQLTFTYYPSLNALDSSLNAVPGLGVTYNGTFEGYIGFIVAGGSEPPGECFVAGQKVIMADGSLLAIEEVQPGDLVKGAGGEINKVEGIAYSVVRDTRVMQRINGNHVTTPDHPHLSADRKTFHCLSPEHIEAYWGRSEKVVHENGVIKHIVNPGLGKGIVKRLTLGHVLLGIDGPVTVSKIEPRAFHPNTPLYNLKVDGSHTYFIDGLAVTGWPRLDDWDYDTWQAKTPPADPVVSKPTTA